MPLGIAKPKGTEVGQKNTPAGFATGMLYTGRVIQAQPVEINYAYSRSRRANIECAPFAQRGAANRAAWRSHKRI